ncbi:MAG: hypothetical protein H0X64_07860 [Gemmatimonadaceae bacterium]|nr:hypothetical protein [Gemmatimonadaceae bacterium]
MTIGTHGGPATEPSGEVPTGLSTIPVTQLVAQRYARERDRFEKLMLRVAQMCRQEIVEANAIRAAVTGRTKDASCLEANVARKMLDGSWPCGSAGRGFVHPTR